MLMDPAPGLLISVAFALLFVQAAWHKLRGLAQFAATVRSYALLPASLSGLVGVAIPLAELLVAAALLVAGTRCVAAVAGAIMLLAYGVAIAVNLARERRDLDCGCTGPFDRRPIAAWMVWRNGILALMLLATTRPWVERPLMAVDGLTILAGLVAAALVYVTIDRLLGHVMPRTAALRRGS
jgi:hypothetical protein